MDNPTVLAASISAFVAVIVAFITSYFTSRSTVKLEMDKGLISTQQIALKQIIDGRLKAYPDAYRILSRLLEDVDGYLVDLEY